MGGIPQLWVPEEETGAPVNRIAPAPFAPHPENPLQLLRDAIDRLKSSGGELPDQAEVADLLAEAREALERATVLARAAAQCEGFLKQEQFDRAKEALETGLSAYPSDPALIARRREVEEREKAFHSSGAARQAIEEATWLLDQDRIDLAFHFLEGKAVELPGQPALISGLEELRALLPQWEEKRYVKAAVARAANLEQMEQGQAALTILEEALQCYPESGELAGATAALRNRLARSERKKKLARRLEAVAQKMAAQSWREAVALLEETRKEFPDAPGLDPLQQEVETGLSRSECEAVAREVRQCLADGELEHAEAVLRQALESLGPKLTLEALREELQSEKNFREELRKAQVLFGRRQLREAEHILVGLAAQDRPVSALLAEVRKARAATEEEDFRERGREKASDLMRQEQFTQAADLLGNLLALFPDDPILRRELEAARSGLSQEPAEPIPAAEAEAPQPPAAPEAVEPLLPPGFLFVQENPVAARGPSGRRFPRAAMVGAASVLLASATGVAWELSRHSAPVANAATAHAAPVPAVTPPPAAPAIAAANTTESFQAPEKSAPRAPAPQSMAAAKPSRESAQPATRSASVLRPFVPSDPKKTPDPAQSSPLPPPPVAGGMVAVPPSGALPLANPPLPPLPAPAAAPPPKPAAPTGGRFEPPQIIQRITPAYPPLARQVKASGKVRVDALIDEHGAVKTVKVLSGQPILAAAAQDAILKWRFKAATLNGQPIANNMVIEVSFSNGNP
jgi:periplasmic protein TonB